MTANLPVSTTETFTTVDWETCEAVSEWVRYNITRSEDGTYHIGRQYIAPEVAEKDENCNPTAWRWILKTEYLRTNRNGEGLIDEDGNQVAGFSQFRMPQDHRAALRYTRHMLASSIGWYRPLSWKDQSTMYMI